MSKYVIDLQIFSKKLSQLMIDKKMVDKKGEPDPIQLYNILYPQDKISKEDINKFGRSYFSTLTRRERNWIKGENYPKNIVDILHLCNSLECDLDYLFTNMTCDTLNKQSICDSTGLSAKSLNKIFQREHDTNDFLNTLISSSNFYVIEHHFSQLKNAIKFCNSCLKGVEECESKSITLESNSNEYKENDKLHYELLHSVHRWDAEQTSNIYIIGILFGEILNEYKNRNTKKYQRQLGKTNTV